MGWIAVLGRLVVSLVFFVLIAAPARAEPIIGRTTVIDGDTLDIRGQRFRPQHVDTPESAQLCRAAIEAVGHQDPRELGLRAVWAKGLNEGDAVLRTGVTFECTRRFAYSGTEGRS